MNIRNIALTLLALVASITFAATASAQNFTPQTFEPNNRGSSHADAMRALGPPAQHRGNQGMPMVDTLPQYTRPAGGFNDFNIQWRGNTIFTPQQRTNNYNYQPYNSQFNAAQLQSSIQNFQRAVQQVRANRQQQQYQWSQPQQYRNYSQPQYQWSWR